MTISTITKVLDGTTVKRRYVEILHPLQEYLSNSDIWKTNMNSKEYGNYIRLPRTQNPFIVSNSMKVKLFNLLKKIHIFFTEENGRVDRNYIREKDYSLYEDLKLQIFLDYIAGNIKYEEYYDALDGIYINMIRVIKPQYARGIRHTSITWKNSKNSGNIIDTGIRNNKEISVNMIEYMKAIKDKKCPLAPRSYTGINLNYDDTKSNINKHFNDLYNKNNLKLITKILKIDKKRLEESTSRLVTDMQTVLSIIKEIVFLHIHVKSKYFRLENNTVYSILISQLMNSLHISLQPNTRKEIDEIIGYFINSYIMDTRRKLENVETMMEDNSYKTIEKYPI